MANFVVKSDKFVIKVMHILVPLKTKVYISIPLIIAWAMNRPLLASHDGGSEGLSFQQKLHSQQHHWDTQHWIRKYICIAYLSF